jgi:hypothetical protein
MEDRDFRKEDRLRRRPVPSLPSLPPSPLLVDRRLPDLLRRLLDFFEPPAVLLASESDADQSLPASDADQSLP